ncbi:class I SAM-dependent methyltransferase [Cohnella sp. REN36]|uniref:class I SAM-dependent methyltransferase n=1 Tax=Cohnella sp. REN36 TaxID=2887347 RepID=UPI001D14262B|nr:class I SAM-dependent methyltransferase [Cohnella sp. REN36]MCC3376092.1 class I SAM-dependent methyltransferase [Cohnella sp. REN36]
MQKDVKTLFDAVARDYDRQRRQLIPCFDDFYGMALALVETKARSPLILDLGAGTGLFSGMVLQKHPDARLTLVDLSEKMLEGARERFGGNPNVRYVVADYMHFLTGAESYDFIVSSLSIHHLPHPAKRELFAAVHRALAPGGAFVNADQVAGNTPAADAYYRRRWLEAIGSSGLSQSAIDASIERRSVDINAKLGDQVAWMEQAGFADADCMYKYLDFGVFYGRKE